MPRKPRPGTGRPRGGITLPRVLAKPMILQGVELAELLLTESSRISQLAKEGVFKRIGKGAYDLKESVQAYVRWQRDQQKRQTIISADSRVRDARARDIEARTAQRLGQLVPLALYDEMIHGFRWRGTQ